MPIAAGPPAELPEAMKVVLAETPLTTKTPVEKTAYVLCVSVWTEMASGPVAPLGAKPLGVSVAPSTIAIGVLAFSVSTYHLFVIGLPAMRSAGLPTSTCVLGGVSA